MKRPLLFALILITGCASKKDSESAATDSVTQQKLISYTDSATTSDFAALELSQDSVINMVYADEKPDSILSFDYKADAYPDLKGSCVNGTLVTISLMTKNQEQKLDLVWVYNENGETVFSPVQSFDVTEGQGEASADIVSDYSLSDACATLAVKEDYEGGDIDLTRSSSITFFAIDKGIISEIFTIQLEDTRVSEYFNTGKENENGNSTTAEMEVLSTSTNGFRDVKVVYTTTINGEETSKEEKILRFTEGVYK